MISYLNCKVRGCHFDCSLRNKIVTVETLAAFREAYEAAEVGDDLLLVISRGGEPQEFTRAKIDASGMVRMRSHP